MQPFGKAAQPGANNMPTIEAETSICWAPAAVKKFSNAKQAFGGPEPELHHQVATILHREPEPEPEPELGARPRPGPDATAGPGLGPGPGPAHVSGLDWLGQGMTNTSSTASALAGAQAALSGKPVVSVAMSRQRAELLALFPPSMRELCVGSTQHLFRGIAPDTCVRPVTKNEWHQSIRHW